MKLIQEQWKFGSKSFAQFLIFQNSPPCSKSWLRAWAQPGFGKKEGWAKNETFSVTKNLFNARHVEQLMYVKSATGKRAKLSGLKPYSEMYQFYGIWIKFLTFSNQRTKLQRIGSILKESCYAQQRWSRGHKARGQGHKKNPRPRTALPRTDTLEAKDRNTRGQGPRIQPQVFSKKRKKDLQKSFSGNLQFIGVARIFDWDGGPNHKSSKIFMRNFL